MRRKKFLSMVGAVALTVTSVAGCKGSDSKETTAQVTSANVEATTASTQGTTAADTTTAAVTTTAAETTEAFRPKELEGADYVGSFGDGAEGVKNASGFSQISYEAGGATDNLDITVDYFEDGQAEIYLEYSDLDSDVKAGPLFLDQETQNKIIALYDKYELWKWNGFSRKAVGVMDGSGFRLDIEFKDGKELTAEGYMSTPEGYEAFSEELNSILRPMLEILKENGARINKDLVDDDNLIRDINITCLAELADETFYLNADNLVNVTVEVKNFTPTITVKGISNVEEQFLNELYISLGVKGPEGLTFKTSAYDGSTTELLFQWNPNLYTWENVVENNVKGSKYYVDPETVDPGTDPGDNVKTTINVMGYTYEVPNIIKDYTDTHPEFDAKYDINYTLIDKDLSTYCATLMSALQDEDQAPDLYLADADFVRMFTAGMGSGFACPYWELGIDVDQKIKDAGIATYIVDAGSKDGEVVGLAYQSSGCAFIYNRDVAKDVFGSDNPAVVQTALGSDWESFFAAAEKCKQKGYAIVSGVGDIWHSVWNSADKGWIVDGKLYIDPKREAFLDIAKVLKDNDYSNDTKDWMEEWFVDMAECGEKQVLGFYGPAWLIDYTMHDHCGATSWHWGVCKPNVGAFWGGTWLIANKNVLNDENLKEGVRELIEYITLDTSVNGLQYKYANNMLGDLFADKNTPASSVVMEMSDGSRGFLGGQDPNRIFVACNEAARGDNLTEYDMYINTYFREAVRYYTSGELSREDALRYFKSSVKTFLPDIIVE